MSESIVPTAAGLGQNARAAGSRVRGGPAWEDGINDRATRIGPRTANRLAICNYSPRGFQFKMSEMGAAVRSTTVSMRKRCPPAATM